MQARPSPNQWGQTNSAQIVKKSNESCLSTFEECMFEGSGCIHVGPQVWRDEGVLILREFKGSVNFKQNVYVHSQQHMAIAFAGYFSDVKGGRIQH
jgi:hypothetical protein